MGVLLALAGAFLLFTGIIWSVHALDRHALARYGYAPFAPSNLLFMLIPHGLLLLSIQGGEHRELLATLAGIGMLAVFLLVRTRTNGWIALYAAPLQLVAAPVLLFAVLFRGLAGPRAGGEDRTD
jgi:hypothetical protein